MVNPLNAELNSIYHFLALLGAHPILHISGVRVKAEGKTIRCEIHKLIISIWNKEKLPEGWKESIIEPIYKKDDKTDCSNYRGISLCQLRTKFYPPSCCLG